MISALIAAHEDGDRLTEEEIHATRLLFVAGYENANNLIGNGTLALLRHPGQWEQLRQDPGLAGGGVEEILHHDAPFQFTRRVAAADLEIGGCQIERGQHLILWLAAANCDPEQFPNSDCFDIHRAGSRHLPSAPAFTPASAARSLVWKAKPPSPPSPGA